MKRWWVQKYKLPPNHPLFMGQSLAALNLEMLEDLWIREQELKEKVKDEEGSTLNEAIQQLQEVRKVLGTAIDYGTPLPSGDDPLVDRWEREIAEGKVPDLDEGQHG